MKTTRNMNRNASNNSNHSLPSGRAGGGGRLWGHLWASLLVFLFTFLLGGCTLSMEDWAPREEDMGKEEPTTIENEYGSITFQFNDSVLYVTENIQEKYLVRVEADSILYFNGSIPREWRPFVGMKMAGGCSHKIPYGLNHKVISVEDQGGILKVVTTRATIEEVYKELNYDIDAGLATPDLSGMTEEELLDYGYELVIDPVTGDSVVMDWNDYDVDHGLRPAGAKRRSLKRYMQRITRADDNNNGDNNNGDDKPKDGSVDGHKDDGIKEEDKNIKDNWETTEYMKVAYDSRDRARWKFGEGRASEAFHILWEAVQVGVDLYKGIEYKGKKFYVATEMQLVENKKVHAKRDEKAEIEESWTDSWTEFDFKAEAGFNYKKTQGQKISQGCEFLVAMADASEQLKELRKKGKIHASKGWDNLKIRVIFTTTPIPMAIVAGANFTPIVQFNGNVAVSGKYTSKTTRAGYRVEKGKRYNYKNEEIVNKDALPGLTFNDMFLNGSFKLGANARVYGGIEFAGTLSVTIGVNADLFAYGNCSFNVTEAVKDKPDEGCIYDNFSGTMGLKCEVYGDLTFAVAPLGLKVWDKKLDFKPHKTLMDYPVRMGASMNEVKGDCKMNGNGDQVTGYYAPTKLDGLNAWMGLHTYYPGMRCYFGPIKNNKWFYLKPADAWYKPLGDVSKQELKETGYFFVFEGDLKAKAKELGVDQIGDLNLVPTFYTLEGYNPYFGGSITWDKLEKYIGNNTIKLDNFAYKTDAGEPRVETHTADQLWAWDADADAGKRSIGFFSTVVVKNGGRIGDWGVKVYLYDHLKRIIKTKSGANYYVIRPSNANRSGRYTFQFSFKTNWSEYLPYYDKDGNLIEDVRKNMKLYFRVIPFWEDPNVQGMYERKYINATDYDSKKHYPLQYEYEDPLTMEELTEENSKTFGSVTTYEAAN